MNSAEHPPDLIKIYIDDPSLGNPLLTVPLPDSPLSTPPNSPRRVDTDDDDDDDDDDEKKEKEEEKKEEEGNAEGEDKPLCLEEIMPVDEYDNDINNNINTKSTNNNETYSNDDLQITTTNSDMVAPFDEAVKKKKLRNKKDVYNIDDKNITKMKDGDDEEEEESVPDDEKNVRDHDWSLQTLQINNLISSNDDDNNNDLDRDELMESSSSIPTNIIEKKKLVQVPPPIIIRSTTTTTITKQTTEKDDNHDDLTSEEEPPPLAIEQPPSLAIKIKSKSLLPVDNEKNNNGDDANANEAPSSLLVKEEVKKQLSFSGRSVTAAAAAAAKISSFTRTKSYDDEPPSLSRIEEAKKRSLNRSNYVVTRGRAKTTPPRPTKQKSTTTTTVNVNVNDGSGGAAIAKKESSESNRLANLKRDIMSLKSSLSDMNEQLYNNVDGGTENNKIRNEIDTKTKTSPADDVAITTNTTYREEVDKDDYVKPNINLESNDNNIHNDEKSNLHDQKKGGDLKSAPMNSDPSTTADFLSSLTTATKSDAGHNDQTTSSQDEIVVEVPAIEVVHVENDEDDEIIRKNSSSILILDKKKKKKKKKKETIEWSGTDTNDSVATNATQERMNSQSESIARGKATTASYRKLTPKKDLQGSDNSASWLEEELRRRAFIKREINNAIESKGQKPKKTIMEELPSFYSNTNLQNSQSTMDEEVAAITAHGRSLSIEDPRTDYFSNDDQPSTNKNVDGPNPRKLDYVDFRQTDEFAIDANDEGDTSGYEGFKPVAFDYDEIQDEMKKFASDTRAALRETSFTDILQDPFSSAVPVAFSSPMSMNRSLDAENPNTDPDFQTNALSDPKIESYPKGTSTDNRTIKINFSDLQANEAPFLLSSLDSFDGIAPGDITLSLLSENTGRADTSVAATWANRVHGAIWRARRMRRNLIHPGEIRPSNTDDIRVGNGLQTVACIQQAALTHLKHDEIDQSITLIEGVVFSYYSFFERSLNFREKNPTSDIGFGPIDFKTYIGVGLHNLGVLNLLKGDYEEALSYFSRAVESRKDHLGDNHPDYISSLVRLAICRYALNEFAEAHARLEEALICAKVSCSTLEDRLQMAEILNNLGCLAYMSGQPVAASSYYRDSMDIQFGALSDSLYIGNAMSGQSISLSISIVRANIGFIKLVTKDLPVAITALENALMEQQILLRGAHDTIIATMDHLALSNLLKGDQEKAALMFNRILQLQKNEYGPHDRRCFVTVDKINMVQSKGVQYEDAIEELRKTFSMPSAPASVSSSPSISSSTGTTKVKQSSRRDKNVQLQRSSSGKIKKKKNKVMQVFSSMRKTNP